MERINELLVNVPELPKEEIYHLIDHASRVTPLAFQVSNAAQEWKTNAN
jgi:hypothetical protein